MKRNVFLRLGWLTLVGFSLLGFAILYFASDVRPIELFEHGISPTRQTIYGILFGTTAAFIGWLILRLPMMQNVRTFYSRLIQNLNLRFADVVFISFCAGFGEEILFRGAVQYYLEPWSTAIIFVAIHGYLNPMNWRLSLYGVYMTIVIGLMGTFYESWGMIFAIVAHFAIDLVLLQKSLRD